MRMLLAKFQLQMPRTFDAKTQKVYIGLLYYTLSGTLRKWLKMSSGIFFSGEIIILCNQVIIVK